MDDNDDDFGDLYTNIPSQPTPTLNNKNDDDWLFGGSNPAIVPPSNWDDDDVDDDKNGNNEADLAAVTTETKHPLSKEVENDTVRVSGSGVKDGEFLFGDGYGDNSVDIDQVPAIPGLDNGGEGRPAPSEDWDSDSDDDLRIVLNDTSHRIGVGEEEEGDEEDLVIVTDEDRLRFVAGGEGEEWGEESLQIGVDGQGKELGDDVKSADAVPGTRIGYGMHGFHPQNNGVYKYTRPGVGPFSGGTVSGAVGPPGAARPPLPLGSVPGRGRGDWRPSGGRGAVNAQRSFSYIPPWTNNSSTRAFGAGLDFTLPSHKTVFDVDIESFEEKPWRYPGVNISDFFNFDLDEDKWKGYCKNLDQLRLESTMQSKIRVYESGRSEQEYDPDLPPELAAVAGHHVISVDNGHAKSENGQVDYGGQEKGSSVLHAPLPTGRAIQVETGSGERLPSSDTRLPRMRDSECVIEIVLQDCYDPESEKNTPEKSENNLEGEREKGFHEAREERNPVTEGSNLSPGPFSGRNSRKSKRVPLAPGGDDSLPAESSAEYNVTSRTKRPKYSGGSSMAQHQGRLAQETTHRIGLNTPERSSGDSGSQSTHSNRLYDLQNKKVTEGMEVDMINSEKSPVSNDLTDKLNQENQFDKENEELTLVNDRIDIEGEDMASDCYISSETIGDDKIAYPNKKRKLCSKINPATLETGEDDELRTSNSDNSRSKSANSRDYMRHPRDGEEVIQEGRTTRTSDSKRSHRQEHKYPQKIDYALDSRQEIDRYRIASRGREEMMSQPRQYREQDSFASRTGRGRSFERMKDVDASAVAWQRREDSLLARRIKDEDMWRDKNSESMSRHRGKLQEGDRNQRYEDLYSHKHVEDVDWRGYSKDEGLRGRDRDNLSLSRYGSTDEVIFNGKRNEEYLRGKTDKDEMLRGHRDWEDSGRRKRERDVIADHRRRDDSRDVGDHRKREDYSRMREKAEDYYIDKHKDGSWRHKDREDKQRNKQLFESAPTDREREDRRGVVRSMRVIEDRPFTRNSRNKDGSMLAGSEKENQGKERRPTEQSREVDRRRAEGLPQHKAHGNVPSREKLVNSEDRSSRHKNKSMHSSNASDNQQINRERHKESTKGKDSSVEEQNGQALVKIKHEEYGGRQNEKVNSKVLNEEESKNASATFSKKDHQLVHELSEQPAQPVRKVGEYPVSDDDIQEASSIRGRSKLERWTSHKKRDFGATDNMQILPASSKSEIKEIEGTDVDQMLLQELPNIADVSNNIGDLNARVDAGQIEDQTAEDSDNHLDTVAKLKRRSERFRQPMPGEKDVPPNRKMENDLQFHTDASAAAPNADTDVKPERPPRKRRWTGS